MWLRCRGGGPSMVPHPPRLWPAGRLAARTVHGFSLHGRLRRHHGASSAPVVRRAWPTCHWGHHVAAIGIQHRGGFKTVAPSPVVMHVVTALDGPSGPGCSQGARLNHAAAHGAHGDDDVVGLRSSPSLLRTADGAFARGDIRSVSNQLATILLEMFAYAVSPRPFRGSLTDRLLCSASRQQRCVQMGLDGAQACRGPALRRRPPYFRVCQRSRTLRVSCPAWRPWGRP